MGPCLSTTPDDSPLPLRRSAVRPGLRLESITGSRTVVGPTTLRWERPTRRGKLFRSLMPAHLKQARAPGAPWVPDTESGQPPRWRDRNSPLLSSDLYVPSSVSNADITCTDAVIRSARRC